VVKNIKPEIGNRPCIKWWNHFLWIWDWHYRPYC